MTDREDMVCENCEHFSAVNRVCKITMNPVRYGEEGFCPHYEEKEEGKTDISMCPPLVISNDNPQPTTKKPE